MLVAPPDSTGKGILNAKQSKRRSAASTPESSSCGAILIRIFGDDGTANATRRQRSRVKNPNPKEPNACRNENVRRAADVIACSLKYPIQLWPI